MGCVQMPAGNEVGAEEALVSAYKDVDTGQLWGGNTRQSQGTRYDAGQKSIRRWLLFGHMLKITPRYCIFGSTLPDLEVSIW